MKILAQIALAVVMLVSALAAKAGGYYTSTTYEYGYDGYEHGLPYGGCSSYSQPYSSSYTVITDSSPGYGYASISGHIGSTRISGDSTQIGDITFHSYSSSDGGRVTGTTTTIGDLSFTTLRSR